MEIIWEKVKNDKSDMTFQQALKVFVDTLNEDGLAWIAWQANIAMAFQDAVHQNPGMDLHGVSNLAATNFLKMLGVTRTKA